MTDQNADSTSASKPHYYIYDPDDSVLICGFCGALVWEESQKKHDSFHRARQENHEAITKNGKTRCRCGYSGGSPSDVEYHVFAARQENQR